MYDVNDHIVLSINDGMVHGLEFSIRLGMVLDIELDINDGLDGGSEHGT